MLRLLCAVTDNVSTDVYMIPVDHRPVRRPRFRKGSDGSAGYMRAAMDSIGMLLSSVSARMSEGEMAEGTSALNRSPNERYMPRDASCAATRPLPRNPWIIHGCPGLYSLLSRRIVSRPLTLWIISGFDRRSLSSICCLKRLS